LQLQFKPDPIPLFPEVDPDPHKNEADPKHWCVVVIKL